MRLLANENFPKIAVIALRAAGHDVSWIPESVPSTDDRNVLALAVAESRVLVTLDKDFGELAFREGLPATCGVILFRLPAIPSLIASIAARVNEKRPLESGLFSTLARSAAHISNVVRFAFRIPLIACPP